VDAKCAGIVQQIISLPITVTINTTKQPQYLPKIVTFRQQLSQMVTEEQDRQAEEAHIQEALSRCCYPKWTMKRVKLDMEVQQENAKKKKKPKPKSVDHKTSVVIPYVEGVSEAVARVYKRYGISMAMRPHTTIRSLLVHPKDKVSKEDTAECVYRIPCKNCQKVYIGETGRSLGVRMKELHWKKVELHEGKKYTRSTRKQSQSEQNKSAITDHVNTENHIINWEEATIIGRESYRTTRWIREAVKIWQEAKDVMNRDEEVFLLSHVYDDLLLSAATTAATPSGELSV